MRTTLQTHIVSSCISLFVQYSLVISLTVAPVWNPAVRAQEKRSGSAPALPTTAADNTSAGFHQSLGKRDGLTRPPSLAENVMRFAKPERLDGVSALFDKESSGANRNAEQDPERPFLSPPPPGIGSGGSGRDGSFNVEPPERLQGPPPGVRSTSEVLNEAPIPPVIPDPIPSTQGYCWPGDPPIYARHGRKRTQITRYLTLFQPVEQLW